MSVLTWEQAPDCVRRAVEAGADGSEDEVRDHQTPWGAHRQGGFRDPFGHVWLVGDKSSVNPLPPPQFLMRQAR
jgi:uncharacterized glyoxalase superfamily protein PhnB